MDRRKASDSPPAVLKLFDGYVHGRVSRQRTLDFLKQHLRPAT